MLSRLKFLQCLYRRASGYIELRFLKSGRRAFISLGQDWGSVDKEITNQLSINKNQDVYFGVATRDKRGGALENIVSIPCVWAEVDFKDIPLIEARKCVNRLKVKPSCITHTGGGIHLYFFLDKPVALKRGNDIRKVNEWLAWELGNGKLDNISDIPRILRLPDTRNLKYPDKPLCKIRLLKDDVRYTLDELLEMIPPEGTENGSSLVISAKKPLQELYSNVGVGKRHDSMTRMVGAWIKTGVETEECLMMANIANSQYRPPLPAEEILSIVQGIKAKDEKKKEIATEFKLFNPTDMGNAKRVAEKCKGVIRFVPEWKKWLVWNQLSGIWQVDMDGIVVRIVKALPSIIKEEINHISETTLRPANKATQERLDKKVKRYTAWKTSSESARTISDAEKLLRTEPGVPLMAKILDTDKMIFNCTNGTVNLKNGELVGHNKDNLITKIVEVEYDEGAECPQWIRFLDKIMGEDKDIVDFLKRAVGYSMTGDITERCIFLLHGVGSNGKSTFINTINSLLGDYGQAASFTSFISKKNNYIPNDIARMQGKRFISSIESEEGTQFSEALIKQLTGGDIITARFLHGEFFDFKPQFKLWLAANHKPTITGTDNAIWTRIKLIPFDVVIPEYEQDKHLTDKLRKEIPGILNWAIEGCLEWQKCGLSVPEGVSLATQDYREEMDVIGCFIKEQCIVNPMVKVGSHELFKEYKVWCEESREKSLTQNKFGRKMTERGFKTNRSDSGRFRIGIGLKMGGQGETSF